MAAELAAGDRHQVHLVGAVGDSQAAQRCVPAEWLIANPSVAVRLAGSADERGTREYNLALGARRAEATRAYLVSLGVPANRLETISHGKERPIAQGSNESAWAQNRNSTTTVMSVSG